MRPLLALALSALPLVGHAGAPITPARIAVEPKDYAWTLKIEFEPIHKAIRGIPISKLDTSWVAASELMKEGIPKSAWIEDGGDSMKSAHCAFSKMGDFEKNGHKELVLVGVFKRKSGEFGNFILILKPGSQGGWQKVFLDSWVGKPGFLAIDLDHPGIEVWHCMECDHSSTLEWDPTKKTFAWKQEPDED